MAMESLLLSGRAGKGVECLFVFCCSGIQGFINIVFFKSLFMKWRFVMQPQFRWNKLRSFLCRRLQFFASQSNLIINPKIIFADY